MYRRTIAIVTAILLIGATQVSAEAVEPYVVATAKKSGLCKVEANQSVTGKWQTFKGCEPFVLGGDRSLFFVQLHINCD
jgi:hypothetical protein